VSLQFVVGLYSFFRALPVERRGVRVNKTHFAVCPLAFGGEPGRRANGPNHERDLRKPAVFSKRRSFKRKKYAGGVRKTSG
jgi:hypothetical protein